MNMVINAEANIRCQVLGCQNKVFRCPMLICYKFNLYVLWIDFIKQAWLKQSIIIKVSIWNKKSYINALPFEIGMTWLNFYSRSFFS